MTTHMPDREKLLEATLAAVKAASRNRRPANRNPLYKPSANYKALALVTTYCDSINEKVENIGATSLAEGIVDEGMRQRELQTIKRCQMSLALLSGALAA